MEISPILLSVITITFFIGGCVAGVIFIKFISKKELQQQQQRYVEIEASLKAKEQENSDISAKLGEEAQQRARLEERVSRIAALEQELSEKEIEKEALQQNNARNRERVSELETRLEEEKKQAEITHKQMQENQKELSHKFESLANRIFEEKGKKFADQNRDNLDLILKPLKEQIGEFKKRVDDVYDKELRDRVSLKTEIENLRKLNQEINTEAKNLTKALTRDNKAQGDWGELKLERLLEEAGLVKGLEFESQATYENEKGEKLRPDFIVHLPESKDVIIDSKVSLESYSRYRNAESDAAKEQALKDLATSVKAHAKGLKEKDYSGIPGMRSLDFVLMFVPVEGALMTVMDKDPALFSQAFDWGVLIVGPTTLFGTLRAIERIWRFDKQSKNAQKMAEEAGKMHDQMVLVLESIEDIGDKLDKAQKAYEQTCKRIKDGRGNLIGRIENVKKLGARTKKEIPSTILEKL